MTEQELTALADTDIVRFVTVDKQFYLVTRHPSMCAYDTARAVMLGHVRCWCLETAKWITVDPARIYAHKALNHIMPETAPD